MLCLGHIFEPEQIVYIIKVSKYIEWKAVYMNVRGILNDLFNNCVELCKPFRQKESNRQREREKGKSEIYICLLGTFLLEHVLSCAVQTSEIQNLVRIT